MPRSPTPYPKYAAAAGRILTYDFTSWADDATITGDDCLIDGWGEGGGADELSFFSQALGFWCTNPGVPQEPAARSTYATFTFTGLPASTNVIVTVGVEFFFQDFGAAGKFVGMQIGARTFSPNVTASGTVPGNEGQIVGSGRTTASGTLEVVFAVENITPSYDLYIIFDTLTVDSTAGEFEDIIIDSAVAWMLGAPVSITRGSLKFDANEEWENYAFPGKTMPVVGLDEVVRSRPVVTGSMMMTGEPQIAIYRPGGEWSDGDSVGGQSGAGARTYVPGGFRAALASGSYLENFIVIWKRLRGDYLAVEFPYAQCTKFGIASQDGDEGQIGVEIEARQANDGMPKTTVPYLVHLLPADFTIGE